MGLDIYVGSLTRYFCRDWQTAVQQSSAATGVPVHVIRMGDEVDEPLDPRGVLQDVLKWRTFLNKGMPEGFQFDWDERPETPYFTDKPAWDCFMSLMLWAAYSEHPELSCPHAATDLDEDPAFRKSSGGDFPTAFPNLLRGCEWWFPCKLPGTAMIPNLGGSEVHVGSSLALLKELDEINQRTWKADDPLLAQWRVEGAEFQSPLELGARFAFALLRDLTAKAVEHRLPLLLDY